MKANFYVLVTLVLCMSCSEEARRKRKVANAPELKVMSVRTQDISVPSTYLSNINAVQFVEIHTRVQGYLEEIYVDEGQFVKKGQPLFRINDNEYREGVMRAEANLTRAIAEAKAKSLEVDRTKLMVEKEIISQTELEVARANQQAAESRVAEARSILQNAKINLNYTHIRAPFDGVIDRIPFKVGSLVNPGTLLTSVSHIDEVFAYFRVSEKEYLQIVHKEFRKDRNGAAKQVRLILADGSLYSETGYIETMEGDFDAETGSIGFRARFPNPNHLLKHGSSGKVVIQRPLDDAVLIPQQSTFSIQDKNYVFVLGQDHVARARSFKAIDRYKDYFIASGVNPGETIILEGLQHIQDGATIRPAFVSADSVMLAASLPVRP